MNIDDCKELIDKINTIDNKPSIQEICIVNSIKTRDIQIIKEKYMCMNYHTFNYLKLCYKAELGIDLEKIPVYYGYERYASYFSLDYKSIIDKKLDFNIEEESNNFKYNFRHNFGYNHITKVQNRKHKNKRINKKWIKRYGYRKINNTPSIYGLSCCGI